MLWRAIYDMPSLLHDMYILQGSVDKVEKFTS